jgi:hypothetical protein
MTPQKKSPIPVEKVALYGTGRRDPLAGRAKRRRQSLRLPQRQYVFAVISPEKNMAFRLPTREREAFLKKYKSKLFEVYGAVMKEYVTVPDALLKNTKELQQYMAVSYEYAKTLKPKVSKKKR